MVGALTIAVVGETVNVPVPSAAVPTTTCGEIASAVNVPDAVACCEAVNVEVCALRRCEGTRAAA